MTPRSISTTRAMRCYDVRAISKPYVGSARREAILAFIGKFLIIAKLEDDDFRAPILGMGREVAVSRRIPVVVKATTNPYVQRTVQLAPLLDQLNCAGK